MGIAENIARSRSQGRTDEEILDVIKQFAPQYKEHIERGVSQGRSATSIVDVAGQFDTQYGAKPGADKNIVERITDPLRHGAAGVLGGTASTLKETGNEGTISEGLRGVKDMVAPENYTPANVTIDPRTWGDIPKALAEAAPGMVPDLATGAVGASMGSVIPGLGTVAGGLIGGIGSYGLRNYGDFLRRDIVSTGGDDTTEATTANKSRAAAAAILGGAASRLGLVGLGKYEKALTGPARASGSLAGQIGTNIGIAGAREGAANVVQEGTEQAILDKKLDGEKLGGALVTGAAGGGAFRAAASGSALSAASKFKDISQADAGRLIPLLQAAHGPDYTGTPKQDYAAVSRVESDLNVRIGALSSDANVKGHLKSLQDADPSSSTAEVLTRVQADVKAGRAPIDADLTHLEDTIGQFPKGAELVSAFRDTGTLGKIKAHGNYDEKRGTLTGGLSGTDFAQNVLHPFGKTGMYADAGMAFTAAIGGSLPGLGGISHAIGGPVAAVAVPAARTSVYGILRGIDGLTGNRSPTKQFLDRFGGDQPALPTAPRGPDFMDALNATRAQQKADALAAKAPDPSEPNWKQIRRTADLMRNSETVEAKRLAAERKGAETENTRYSDESRTAQQREDEQLSGDRRVAEAVNRRTDDEARSQEHAATKLARDEAKAARDEQKRVNDMLTRLGRQAALQRNSAEASSTSADIPIRVAKLKLQLEAARARADEKIAKADAAAEKAAEKAQKQAVPKVAVKASKAASEAPSRPSVEVDPRDPTFAINTKNGTRNQSIAATKSQRAYGNAVKDNVLARETIFDSAMEVPGLSQHSIALLGEKSKVMLDRTMGLNNGDAARGVIERFLDMFPKADRTKLREYFLEAEDPVTGKTFYNTWGD